MKNRLMQFLFGGPGTASALGDFGLLVVRVTFGAYMCVAHGWDKIYSNGRVGPSQDMIGGVRQMGFPAPTAFAWAAALAEFLCAALIALGLFTRPAALALGFNMAVAAFVAHAKDGWAAREMALLYFAPCVLLLFTGAGRFSIDRFVRRRAARAQVREKSGD